MILTLCHTRFGPMLAPCNDFFCGHALIKYGEYALSECNLIANFLPPGSVALDVGANIGSITIPMMKAVGPTGRVFAFEPQSQIYRLLAANMALNHDEPYSRAFNCAVGNMDGFVQLACPTYDKEDFNNFGRVEVEIAKEGIPIKKLDSLRFPACHFIKVDVEGWETEVLQGAEELIRKHRPILLVENDRPQKGEELMKTIEAFGYRAYWAITPLYNPHNFRGDAENVYDLAASIDNLCIPQEAPQTRAEELNMPEATLDNLEAVYRQASLL